MIITEKIMQPCSHTQETPRAPHRSAQFFMRKGKLGIER